LTPHLSGVKDGHDVRAIDGSEQAKLTGGAAKVVVGARPRDHFDHKVIDAEMETSRRLSEVELPVVAFTQAADESVVGDLVHFSTLPLGVVPLS
jgi:hypothetical protein